MLPVYKNFNSPLCVWYSHVYLCIGETHNNLKLDKESEIEFCQEYKYLGVIFDTSGTDDKEIRSRVIQARKCIACLTGYCGVKT